MSTRFSLYSSCQTTPRFWSRVDQELCCRTRRIRAARRLGSPSKTRSGTSLEVPQHPQIYPRQSAQQLKVETQTSLVVYSLSVKQNWARNSLLTSSLARFGWTANSPHPLPDTGHAPPPTWPGTCTCNPHALQMFLIRTDRNPWWQRATVWRCCCRLRPWNQPRYFTWTLFKGQTGGCLMNSKNTTNRTKKDRKVCSLCRHDFQQMMVWDNNDG